MLIANTFAVHLLPSLAALLLWPLRRPPTDSPGGMAATFVHRLVLPADLDQQHVELRWAPLDARRDSLKVLSWVRVKPTWVEPKIYPSLRAHPELASSLILLKDWGSNDPAYPERTLAVYPVSTLQTNHNLVVRDGKVLSNVRRVAPGEGEVFVVCAESIGRDEREIVRAVVEKAREVVGGRARREKRVEFWDGIGICTWESFGGSHRTPDRPTLPLLLSLVPPIPIKHFLIDDGWQDITPTRRLRSSGEWDGMQAPMSVVVAQLKARGAAHVGVWVTLEGYWLGIDPDGELAQAYGCTEFKIGERGPRGLGERPPSGDSIWLPAPDKALAFWTDWFRQMKEWGLTFVKVDNQAAYDVPVGPGAAHAMQAMWSGMLEAAHSTFGSTDRIIMCMSHTERMLNGPGGLDFDRPEGALVFRNSDDFNLKFDTAHQSFVNWNLYQSILTSHLSFTPDYDMFMTAQPTTLPAYHALLRAMAPGPLLISDTPDDKIDTALIGRLVGTTHAGEQRAVKARRAAQALPSRWFWDNMQGGGDGPALLGATTLPHVYGAMIGAWNTRDGNGRAKDGIRVVDIEDALGVGALSSDCFVVSVGVHAGGFGRPVLVPQGLGHEARVLDISLPPGTCESYVVARAWDVGGRKIGVLGLKGMLTPLCGIEHVDVVDGELVVQTDFKDQTVVVVVQSPDGSPVSLTVKSGGQAVEVSCASEADNGGQATCIAEFASAPEMRIT